MIINKWLQYSYNFLKKNEIKLYQLESVIMLSFVLKKSKSWIYGYSEKKINFTQLKILKKMLKRRVRGEPIAYILGFCEFWSLKIYVSHNVLIPRQDTEILVNVACKKINFKTQKILDLGTGSGIIALVIANRFNNLNITAVDFRKKILNIAKYNAKKLLINNITFLKSNWFSKLKNKKFDVIVSNPPYISYKEYFFFKKKLRFEPITSLVACNNGLANFHYIISESLKYLNNYGWLILEHGYKQSNTVQKILKKNYYRNITKYTDIQGYYRVICAQKILL
ncbi:peptide chain release factor N(5)-glutamine methyltransferase [Enterobacteriaceae endosymbiont of Donacia tomentosa]|uniref:peptide chain release factor N(5)-glutamine methyltransferase n=1 Tax=Enterobacteriaceae endosymbiont of Donacia tomentosa TaxID=2675787 RepID=UPI001448DF05|nr:peptide chain release factor N(5)-glutamine methyltransferase [Enterobacteriaceae endosymbiont of Donacia tomentosa]QJC31556.1 peptide chain release factor N(5)-glutamine methyltransferase [Enterobacteriaceae endosymbiont of Donacia tomentosa]